MTTTHTPKNVVKDRSKNIQFKPSPINPDPTQQPQE